MLLYFVDYVCAVMQCHAVWNGEENVKFLQENVKLNEFKKKLLLMYNLIAQV
jgi:hypothetical protein